MYADDTSLTFAGVDLKHIDDYLKYDLNRVYTWLSANKLTLNLTKTEFMLAASRQKLSTFPEIPSFSVNDHPVKQVSSTKSLGVHIDQNMNWECHIQNICKKIASALGAIKRIRHLIPFNILIKVYYSLVQPHFYYCGVVWGNCGNGLSEKLQKLQNRAARILMCANYDSNIDELFRALGWRKLKYQRLESAAVMMYKSLHGMTPEYLSSRFVFRNDVTSYRLRNTVSPSHSAVPVAAKHYRSQIIQNVINLTKFAAPLYLNAVRLNLVFFFPSMLPFEFPVSIYYFGYTCDVSRSW